MLITRRLRLRRFLPEDLERLAQLTANLDFMRFSIGVLDWEGTRQLLGRLTAAADRGGPHQFALIHRETTVLIGYCGFFRQTVDGVEQDEIAYRLDPEYWNQGLATEAAERVRDYARDDLQLTRVISLIHPENHASRRVVEKLGMTREKETTFRGFPVQVYALSFG